MFKHCPCCGSDKAVPLPNSRIMCPICNVTFKIEEDGSAITIDNDPIGKINKRIDELEGKLPNPAGAKQPEMAAPQADDEMSEENDGFIDFGANKNNGKEKTE